MIKLNLYKLSKIADIRSVAFDNDYVQIIVRSKRSSIDYSIVNTYLPQSNNWEITPHPYTGDCHVITSLFFESIIHLVDTAIIDDFVVLDDSGLIKDDEDFDSVVEIN